MDTIEQDIIVEHDIGAFALYLAVIAREYEDSSPEEMEEIIRTDIIPKMALRRGRDKDMSTAEIREKLNRPPCSDKPGEYHEWAFYVARDSDTGNPFSSDQALEVADLIYYELQPNSNCHDKMFWSIAYGETPLPYIFCILKYRTRLRYGDRKDYKKVESYVMDVYLEALKHDANKRYDWLLT